MGEAGRECAGADALFGKQHRHSLAIHCESSGNLRSDEATADDHETLTLICQLSKAPVIL
jgi:hypothetical protein